MRRLGLLSEKQIRNLKPDRDKFVKRVADGGGLYLQATLSTDGVNRNWIFRYEMDKVRHDLGLGPLHTVGLAEARRKATELRLQIYDGVDPAGEREALKRARMSAHAERLKATTFLQCWQGYFKQHAKEWTSRKHVMQWESTMRDYVLPTLGRLNVADIETSHVVKALEPIWNDKPVTASRVQNRIKLVMAYAIAAGFRASKDNPADRTLVKTLLGKPQQSNGHHDAMPYSDAPVFVADLRKLNTVTAKALEFTILCAVRTSEATGATWDEIDLKHKLWVIPAERMKSNREHRVPLSDRAIHILNSLPHRHGRVFLNGRSPLSESVMPRLLKRVRPGVEATVHGFRSTFRDWAGDRTNYPRELCELCLAHAVGDKTEAAYRRGDGLAKRFRLMQTWADYLGKPVKPATVTDMAAERAARRAS